MMMMMVIVTVTVIECDSDWDYDDSCAPADHRASSILSSMSPSTFIPHPIPRAIIFPSSHFNCSFFSFLHTIQLYLPLTALLLPSSTHTQIIAPSRASRSSDALREKERERERERESVSRGRRQKGPGQRGQRDTPKGFYTDRDGSDEEEEGVGRRMSAKRKRRGQEDDDEDSDEDEEEEEEDDNSNDDSEDDDDDDDEEEKDSGPSNWSCTVQHCIVVARIALYLLTP
jgi:hypothetical protein